VPLVFTFIEYRQERRDRLTPSIAPTSTYRGGTSAKHSSQRGLSNDLRAPKPFYSSECPRRESNSRGVAPGGF